MSSRKNKLFGVYRRTISGPIGNNSASFLSDSVPVASARPTSRSLNDIQGHPVRCDESECALPKQEYGLQRQSEIIAEQLIKGGWGKKESGQAFLGKHNWKRRFFRLVQSGHLVTFSYFEYPGDKVPKGQVLLTQDYAAREIEFGERSKPNCFALGPLMDSSALRTYYVSCDNDDEKLDWILVINSAIEGAPEKAWKRKATYRIKKDGRAKGSRITYMSSRLPSNDEGLLYIKHSWRMLQWSKLHHLAKHESWKRWETRNGVTISRQSFKSSEMAIIKIEGLLPAPKELVYEFLVRSIKLGGKFDFIFRTEELLQKIEDQRSDAYMISNIYEVPLPGMKSRDVCLIRMWIPDHLTCDSTSGMFIHSINHPGCPATKDHERVDLEASGVVFQEEKTVDGNLQTKATFIIQVDLKSSLQNMLRGAYKSGLLKKGLLNSFQHLYDCVESYRTFVYMDDI